MKAYIPPQVIRHLVKYAVDGCILETRLEDLKDADGEYTGDIRRWYVISGVDRICVWSEETNPKEGEDGSK